ncbi:MAG: molybdopterin-dependent oxidoreductase [Phycisphaera sp. RhM]|nr:molybdopterin-dependent oxidoreductase [Phycisphaera sp. RhM]
MSTRGNPKPHTLSDQKRSEVGLTRDTWRLDVISDPENPARLRSPLSQDRGTAFDFPALMELAKTHVVRFPKVMTCLNIGCPLGNEIWEGVPLRDVLWLTQPTQVLRRVFYHGYHNDDEEQLFRSSLPVGPVLEDPFGLPPVILCYKLNGRWLTPERGGPVRIVVPFPNDPQRLGWEGEAPKRMLQNTFGFESGTPIQWPIRLTQAHWATLHPGLPAGEYVLRCRTIDQQNAAQPMPRPFRKSGHAAIEQKRLVVG